ncbi:MAG: glycosyltransferase family 2 protein [Sphingomonadaceae bacterium]
MTARFVLLYVKEGQLQRLVPLDISVIIPTCDRPDYVREALASVRAQQAPPREILVIDNGTRTLCSSGMPPEVQLFRLPAKVGPSRARNFGAAIATSTHLAFLDDDDSWDPSFLFEAFSTLEKEQVRCVYGRKALDVPGGTIDYRLATPDNLNVATLLRRNPGTGGMNLLIERRLFLEIGGFDDRLRLSEDRALALEVLLSGERIAVAPDAVAVVRQHTSDRLRQRPIRKFPFVWKYRRLYSATGFAMAVARILAAAGLAQALRTAGIIRNLIRRENTADFRPRNRAP